MNRIKIIAAVVLAATALPSVEAQAAPTPYGRGIQDRPRVIAVAATAAPVVLSRPR